MRKYPQIGEQVEFYSSDGGGCWKCGVVATKQGRANKYRCVRIQVGGGVCVMRPLCKVRVVRGRSMT